MKNELDYGTIGVRVRAARKKLGLTQEELANAVGVSRQTIISLESGRYTASLPLAFRLANYFGTTIENIFVYEEEEK